MMLAPTTLVLVVSPSLNPDGGRAYSSRGGLFDGAIDGRRIVKRSTTPFCDGARALLAEGVDPATKFVMRDAGSAADALRATVGVATRLAVRDGSVGNPVFTKWSPYDRAGMIPVTPPMRENGSAATLVPSEPRRILPDRSAEIREDELLRQIEAMGGCGVCAVTLLDDDMFGSVAVDPRRAEGLVKRVAGRIRHMADRGVLPTGGVFADVAAIQDHAAERTELAQRINEALAAGDQIHAQRLIQVGGVTFAYAAMLATVEGQALKAQLNAPAGGGRHRSAP